MTPSEKMQFIVKKLVKAFWLIRIILLVVLMVSAFLLFLSINHGVVWGIMLFTLITWKFMWETYHFWIHSSEEFVAAAFGDFDV